MGRPVVLLVALALLAGCGGSSQPKGADGDGPDPTAATATTLAGGSARFTVLVGALVGGQQLRTSETGQISFRSRLAHVYKLLASGGVPQEVVIHGPWTYTNANIDRAIHDTKVRPWTKLDTRRLTAAQRGQHPDELAHVRVLVHLPDGAKHPVRIGSLTVAGARVTQFNGEIEPKAVVAKAPPAVRADLRTALANDYPAKPFPASYWLDDAGRVRRVLVAYRTPAGTRITIDGRFSAFGTPVDTRLPAASSIEDITP